jgi:hypothetical protein
MGRGASRYVLVCAISSGVCYLNTARCNHMEAKSAPEVTVCWGPPKGKVPHVITASVILDDPTARVSWWIDLRRCGLGPTFIHTFTIPGIYLLWFQIERHGEIFHTSKLLKVTVNPMETLCSIRPMYREAPSVPDAIKSWPSIWSVIRQWFR